MKYSLCRNFGCACMIGQGQDFCDNCQTPTEWFLKAPEYPLKFVGATASPGVSVGTTTDGCPVFVPVNDTGYGIYGMTQMGKTTLATKIAIAAENDGIVLTVLDPEGQWSRIIPHLTRETRYHVALANIQLNPFDVGGEEDKGLVRLLLKESVFRGMESEYADVSPQMNYCLDDAISQSSSMIDLIENIRYYSPSDSTKRLNNLEKTITALLVRVEPFEKNPVLRSIFYCKKSNISFPEMRKTNHVISTHPLDSRVAYGTEQRLLINSIAVGVLREAYSAPDTDVISNMVVIEEARQSLPKILRKILVTDTWPLGEYVLRGAKRGNSVMVIAQRPTDIEKDITSNLHTNFHFRTQSEEEAKHVAAEFGITHYARVNSVAGRLASLRNGEFVLKSARYGRPFALSMDDFRLAPVEETKLESFMPPSEREDVAPARTPLKNKTLEEVFLQNVKDHPFIMVAERRDMLTWDEDTYSRVVRELVRQGAIEKQNARLGVGRPRVIYNLRGQVPSALHEFYCHWLASKLADLPLRLSKVGPDLQIELPDRRKVGVHVELGSSDMRSNLRKAKDFDMVVVAGDDKAVLDSISKEEAQNVLCAFVQDVPGLIEKMRVDAASQNY